MTTFDKVCKVCGKEFVATNYQTAYCSELCRAVRRSAVRGYSPQKVKACAMCGKEFVFKNNKKYCSKSCAWKAKQEQCQRKSKSSLSTNGTICWKCKWATGKDGHCPWASHLHPVSGWKAKKTHLRQSEGHYTDSYIVNDCPLFEEG